MIHRVKKERFALFKTAALRVGVALAVWVATAVVASSTWAAAPALTEDCLSVLSRLKLEPLRSDGGPHLEYAYGTTVPLARAFEKEGLSFYDIADVFDLVEPKVFIERVQKRFALEKAGKAPRYLHRHFLPHAASRGYFNTILSSGALNGWDAMTPEQQLAQIIEWVEKSDNALRIISPRGAKMLFGESVITFDDLKQQSQAHPWLLVGDDLGSYEVKNFGSTDLREYLTQRAFVEELLEGRVGHQHKVHAWPDDPAERARIAPQYIELIDAGTWYLFWVQAARNPTDVATILNHPYLGVYTRASLDRLYRAMVEGRVDRFNDKFRMIGARNVPARPESQAGERTKLPDLEMRSGNKTPDRSLLENLIEARLISGDYTGLKDFRTHTGFELFVPIETLVKGFRKLSTAELKALKEFEVFIPELKFNPHPLAKNHFRTKYLSPLFAWSERLGFGTDHLKRDRIQRAQARFANELVALAQKSARARREVAKDATAARDLRAELLEDLDRLTYRFARSTRLDRDFLQYLMPFPEQLPSITVKSTGPINVNAIDLGLETSFRFPIRPTHGSQVLEGLEIAAQTFLKAMGGGKIKRMSVGGHGHGLSTRLVYTDPKGRPWRFEHDGIQRRYQADGSVKEVFGGHIEVPTPKFSPQNMDELATLYRTMRNLGLVPSRDAGGCHINVDLSTLQAMDPREGARKAMNIILAFEETNQLTRMLFQSPSRVRSGIPVDLSDAQIQAMRDFDGDWDALGKFLFEIGYFNPDPRRKPKYTQLNATGLMTGPEVPKEARQDIDIKNPFRAWELAFGEKPTGRLEFRLFDAMEDEYHLALEIKYVRALLNRALNVEGAYPARSVLPDTIQFEWLEYPERWVKAVEAHLKSLGLDPKEYRGLIADAIERRRPADEPGDGVTGRQLLRKRVFEEEEEF